MSVQHSPNASLPAEGDNVYPYGRRYAWYVLLLLALLYVFDFFDRMVVASLFSDLNRDLGVTPGQFGLLTGIVNISIAVLAFPSALLVDRWSRKGMVGTMVLVWGAASLACSIAGSFWHLLFLRFVVGAGEAGYGPGASTIVQGVFPANRRSSALGLLQSAGPIGLVLGMMVGGIVAQRWGWRHAFGLVAIPGALIAILVFFFKEPPRAPVTKVNKETGQTENVPLISILKKILRTRSLMLIFVGMALALAFYAVVGVWVPSFFRYTEGLGQEAAGFKGAGIMIAGAIGTVFGGLVADKIARKNRCYPLRYAAFCMFATTTCFLLGLKALPRDMLYPCLLAGGFFLNNILAITYNSVLQASHEGIRATALGCLIVVQNIFGMAVGASLSGYIAGFFGKMYQQTPEYLAALAQSADAANNAMLAYGIENAFVVMAVAPLIAGVAFALAGRCFNTDCEGAECFE